MKKIRKGIFVLTIDKKNKSRSMAYKGTKEVFRAVEDYFLTLFNWERTRKGR